MKTTKKERRIIGFLALLLALTVGYAALSSNLNINGTTSLNNATWSIIWDNVQVKDGSVSGDSVTTAASITNTEKTLVEYSISLKEPGEFYEFTVDAKNEGSIDAMIGTFSNKVYEANGTTEKNLPSYLNYTVTYSDGVEVAANHKLSANTTEKYKVRVEYKKDIEASQLPTEAETIKFKFEVDYVQADDTAEEVVHGLTGTRYTTNKYINGNDNEYVWVGKKPTDNITLYNTEAEAKNAFNNRPFYLKHELENDVVKDSYVCFENDSNTYCLRGQVTHEKVNNNWQCKSEFLDSETNNCLSTYYESNKTILKQAFGESNCTQYSSYLNCSAGGLSAQAYLDGSVSANDGSASCGVLGSGSSRCYEW